MLIWGVLDFKFSNGFKAIGTAVVSQPRVIECHFLCNIHWMNHCLPLTQGGPVAQDARGLILGCQEHPLCPDLCIWSPCHVSYSAFQRHLAEPSGVIVCDLSTCACCGGGAGDKREKSLTRQWL